MFILEPQTLAGKGMSHTDTNIRSVTLINKKFVILGHEQKLVVGEGDLGNRHLDK